MKKSTFFAISLMVAAAFLTMPAQAQPAVPFTIIEGGNVSSASSEVTDTAVSGYGYRFAFTGDTLTTVNPYLMLGKSYAEQAMPVKIIVKARSPLWVIGVTQMVVALDRGGIGDTGSYSQICVAYPSSNWLTYGFEMSEGGTSFSRLRLILSLVTGESGTRTVFLDEIRVVSALGDTTMLDDGGNPPSDVAEMRINGLPNGFSLRQNYPNPFNPRTMIRFSVPKHSQVTLKVYNVLGKEVATLVNREVGAGSYEVPFNASQLPTGTYFCRLYANGRVETKKMVLSK